MVLKAATAVYAARKRRYDVCGTEAPMWAIRTLGLWVVLLCALSACAPPLPRVDPVQLSGDIEISLGGNRVIVPVVAVTKWTEEGDLVVPQSPVESLEIFITVYGSAGEMVKSREICPLLTRQWSKSICQSSYTPLYQSLPRQFTLLTEAGLSGLRNTFLSGVGQTKFDVVSTINFNTARPDRACSNRSLAGNSFCWAGYQLSNGLLVLWQGRPEDDARSAEMIQIFVDNALGADENFDLVERAAVGRRLSSAPCTRGQPYNPEVMERVRLFRGLTECDAP